jgi:hypothetical protein
MTFHTNSTTNPHHRLPPWLRRVGKLGFAFFFIKGVAWMMLPLALWLMD